MSLTRRFGAAVAAFCALGVLGSASCAGAKPGTFATPEEAAKAVEGLLEAGDPVKTEEIFGPGSLDMFRSGDQVSDKETMARVRTMLLEKTAFSDDDDKTKLLLFGEDEWPFPIPLVLDEGRWRFDTAAGREELLNRRIGANELLTLAALHETVEAQREYRSEGRDGLPRAFARKFWSSEGKRDGLSWPTGEGEPLSPLGDLIARAAAKGYRDEGPEPEPYSGYYYSILTGQGSHAPGGERSYLDAKGLLTSGFAVIAWPAKYGNSGVMTFQVNHRGFVFQKDLGADTAALAQAITAYAPDETWSPTPD